MSLNKEKFHSTAIDYLKYWSCKPDGEIFYTHSSLLWPVIKSGQKLLLKIVDLDDDEANAAEVLKFFNGSCSVKLVESENNIQLLERITKSSNQKTLEQMVLAGDDDKATEIICDVISQLHKISLTNVPPSNLIPFRQRSDEMRKQMNDGRVSSGNRPIFQIAYDLCEKLIQETLETQILLHGDIHHFNILYSAERGWVAIDPKGIKGPRVYEYANSLCNPYMHKEFVANAIRMDRQASVIAEKAELNKALLLQFTFLHAMQCAAWSLFEPDQDYWLSCARTAAKLAKIKL